MRTLLCYVCFLCAFMAQVVSAGTITGAVVDADSHQPVPAVAVFLDETPYGAVSGENGQFVLTGVPSGTYTLTASHVAFNVRKVLVNVTDAGITVDLPLDPVILSGETVVVTATRARSRLTPVTFSNLSSEEIRENYFAQDVPMMLQTLPSMYAHSDAGNGIGYSYLKIRGFNQQRVNVLINGIPHNGPTSHEVYWVDMPDLLANAEDVQVQRGVGSSIYGSSALGGTVNVITSNFSTDRKISLYAGMGSYNTRKYSFAFNSGLVDEKYVMYGRFSRITSDGYRDQSWSKLWSYFLGVARYDVNMTTTFQIYGGPEQVHLSYYGVTRDYLDGTVTGDAREDRRYNPLTYEDELDNFNQPHYELHHNWAVTSDVTLDNTLYTIKGRGNYDQFRRARSLEEFRISRFAVSDPDLYPHSWYVTDDNGNPVADNGSYTVKKSDLIKSRWVENDEWGWLPKVTLEHPGGRLTLGGEVRLHTGNHWGNISWLSAAPQGIEPDYVYYSYRERKRTLSFFAQEMFKLTNDITVMADLQGVRHTYELDRDTVTNYQHETTFQWLSPRLGINYNITDRLHTYANVSFAKREPTASDLIDPQDYWDTPKFSSRETLSSGTIQLTNPTVEEEELIDFEFGAGYQSPALTAMVNLYHMDFRNEIVPWAGQISEASGLPVTGNAERSVHQGIELELATRPFCGTGVFADDFLELRGNINVNNDHFVDYTEYFTDWDAYAPLAVERDGNRMAGFPDMLANVNATVNYRGVFAGFAVRYVGRQYLDNSETRDNSIDPYTVADATLGYRLGNRFGLQGMEIRLQINNVFDTLYEAAGYMDDVGAVAATNTVYGTPYFIPAATRNVLMSIRWDI